MTLNKILKLGVICRPYAVSSISFYPHNFVIVLDQSEPTLVLLQYTKFDWSMKLNSLGYILLCIMLLHTYIRYFLPNEVCVLRFALKTAKLSNRLLIGLREAEL